MALEPATMPTQPDVEPRSSGPLSIDRATSDESRQRLERLDQRRRASAPRRADNTGSESDMASLASDAAALTAARSSRDRTSRSRRPSSAASAKIVTTGLSFTAMFAITAGYAVADRLAADTGGPAAESSPPGTEQPGVGAVGQTAPTPAAVPAATNPAPLATSPVVDVTPNVLPSAAPTPTESSAPPTADANPAPAPVTVTPQVVEIVDLAIPPPPTLKPRRSSGSGQASSGGAASPAPAPTPAPAPAPVADSGSGGS